MHITIYNYAFHIWDIIAFIWFCMCWFGYSYYAGYGTKNYKSLVGVAYHHYLHWMNQMIQRSDRIVDTRVAEILMTSIRFYASTSVFVLAGLVTLLGYGEKGKTVVSSLPFVVDTDTNIYLWNLKISVLIVIFTYSFFKHTWSLRQYNYVNVLIGAAPPRDDKKLNKMEYSKRCAKIVFNAANHFNMGMRGYYFGLAVLGWFIHPLLFMLSTTWVVIVLYRREFLSRVLNLLSPVQHQEHHHDHTHT